MNESRPGLVTPFFRPIEGATQVRIVFKMPVIVIYRLCGVCPIVIGRHTGFFCTEEQVQTLDLIIVNGAWPGNFSPLLGVVLRARVQGGSEVIPVFITGSSVR